MDLRLLVVYFLIGGVIVAATTYLGSLGRGYLAAFVALFPGITVITFIAIYLQSGPHAVEDYAKGILILTPAWVLYILGIFFLVPRIGMGYTLLISVGVYLLFAFITIKITHGI